MAKRARHAKSKNLGRLALMVGAPGQVLRDPAWLRQHRPLVLVLTRGQEPGTMGPVSRLVSELGCRQGCLFGRLTNPQLHEALDQGNHSLFKALALELADYFLREPIDQIFVGPVNPGDPASFVCRWLVDAAVQLSWTHRPQLRIGSYANAAAALLPFPAPLAEPGLQAVRESLRAFVQGDLAWAA